MRNKLSLSTSDFKNAKKKKILFSQVWMDHVWRLDGPHSTGTALSCHEAFCYRLGAPCRLGSVFSGDSLTSFLVNLHFLKCTMMLASNSLGRRQTITAEPCFPNLKTAIKRS